MLHKASLSTYGYLGTVLGSAKFPSPQLQLVPPPPWCPSPPLPSPPSPTYYNSLNPPVTPSTTPLGPGPTPNTVALPLTTCVRPASRTTRAHRPAPSARARSVSSSASEATCVAILA